MLKNYGDVDGEELERRVVGTRAVLLTLHNVEHLGRRHPGREADAIYKDKGDNPVIEVRVDLALGREGRQEHEEETGTDERSYYHEPPADHVEEGGCQRRRR